MPFRSIMILLAVLSALAVAGCGVDSIDRSSGNPAGPTSASGVDELADDTDVGLSIPPPQILCESPAANVVIQPGESIQDAVDANTPGTIFLLAAGTHRLEKIVRPKMGNEFFGQREKQCHDILRRIGVQ